MSKLFIIYLAIMEEIDL